MGAPQPSGLPTVDLDDLVVRITALRSNGGGRRIVGLTGPPGAGKSTVAAILAARMEDARIVPMDGFHLAQRVLDERGIADRKGAPHTFDAAGFVALLARLRTASEIVWAPRFDRELEEPVAGALEIDPGADLVIVEGNYLLLDDAPWHAVRGHLDLVVHLVVDPAVRVERLVARHVAHGRSAQAARRWVERSDEVNARIVESARHRADLLLAGDSWTVPD
ncbi:MAG: nucleoside/nucleotide kinase family protein [Actinomycetota bacterium]